MEQEQVADLIKKAIAFGYERGMVDMTDGHEVDLDQAGEEYFNEFILKNHNPLTLERLDEQQ